MNFNSLFYVALTAGVILWSVMCVVRAALILQFRLQAINFAWAPGVAPEISKKRVQVYRRYSFDDMLVDWRKWTFKQFYPEFEEIHVSHQ